jgi:hypothetical protein
MIEADAPSTGCCEERRNSAVQSVLPVPPGWACSHHPRSRATHRGRKAKAALPRMGKEQRGQHHKHYR